LPCDLRCQKTKKINIGNQVAIYHLSVKTIGRSAGRSATAAAAYRAGVKIADERTCEIHDYSRKCGVESAELVLPADAPKWATDRSALWNAAEQSETRKNSTVAREFEIALPAELSAEERRRLAVDFAREIVDRHGCAADVAIHAPSRGGDNHNHDAHILCSTRKLTPDGFTQKTRELDDRKTGEVERWRERFASLQNERLREAGIGARVDHRRLKDQGIEREPTRHLGVAATGYERRTGESSRKRQDFEREVAERLARAKLAGELERQEKEIDSALIELSSNLTAARAERDRQADFRAQAKQVEAGKQQALEAFQHFKAEQTPKKPVLSPVELAEQIKAGFFEEAKAAWREKMITTYTQQAEAFTAHYWELRKEEPKEPLLFGKKAWLREHGFWADAVNAKKVEVDNSKKQARDTQAGKFDTYQNNIWDWNQKAQERLERERPELAQALKAQRLADQQKAKETAAANKAISAFKSLAIKRESKALGYGDSGKKWNALPEGQKASIDDFNSYSQAARSAILEEMCETLKNTPGAAEKLIQQIEKGNEKDRGMSR